MNLSSELRSKLVKFYAGDSKDSLLATEIVKDILEENPVLKYEEPNDRIGFVMANLREDER